MIFSSTEFLLFLVAVLLLARVLPSEGARRNLLLGASYLFYGWWDWRFTFLMFAIEFVFRMHRLATAERAPRTEAVSAS